MTWLAALAFLVQTTSGPAAAVTAEPVCEMRRFEGASFEVCPFDSTRHEITLLRTDNGRATPRRMTGLPAMEGVDPDRVRFAMNAGIFMEDGRPLGLFVARGVEERPLNRRQTAHGNFYLQPNGVFSVDVRGRLSILTTSDFAETAPDVVWATQSGPMLVIDGEMHPRIAHDGESWRIRNGVGLISETEAVFVISRSAVSFGRFARFFRDEIGAMDALYLDGSVSSLWRADTGAMDSLFEIGPVILVSDRDD